MINKNGMKSAGKSKISILDIWGLMGILNQCHQFVAPDYIIFRKDTLIISL